MHKTLIEKLNELTDSEFDYLKLNRIDVFIKTQAVEFHFLYPVGKDAQINLFKDKIAETVKKILQTTLNVTVKFKKSIFDFDYFRADLFTFLSAFPSIANTVSNNDVTCEKADETHLISIVLEKSVYDYCIEKKVLNEIYVFIGLNFCDKIKVELVSKTDSNFDIAESVEAQSVLSLDDPSGRFIRPQNVEEFIGTIVYEPANYIEDANKAKEGAVLCGTIGKVIEIMRKKDPPADGEAQKKLRRIFKFGLTDYTGTINCVFFASQKNVDQFLSLNTGKQVVCRGNLTPDMYKNDGSFEYTLKDICLCTLPKDFVVNRLKRNVPAEYKTVFPSPYVVTKQESLFDSLEKSKEIEIPPFLLDKTFCVFDIETTGFNTDFDSIIEIGAVKLVNGLITETFSSFIDPMIPIPARITALTHISDEMVHGQPKIDEVLPDFYKFCHETILVGHNVQFDYGFVSVKGKALGIYFDCDRMDTLSLARKYFPKIGKYKLENLVNYFNVKNEGAHRAIYDALATTEIFIEISKMMA